MICRAIDGDNDWQYGKSRNSYVRNNRAVMQLIKTRLQSFVGDCFFAANDGLDWWNLLGSKNEVALNLAITATILNTPYVIKLVQLSTSLDEQRNLTLTYEVNTSFTGLEFPLADTVSYIITESGDFLTTEDGDEFIT